MEEGPPGDDDYTRASGESGLTQQAHNRFPPAPVLAQPPALQREEPHKVKLSPIWVKDTRAWFTLAESTFNRNGVTE